MCGNNRSGLRMRCEFLHAGQRCWQKVETLGFCAYHLRIGWIHAISKVPVHILLDRYYNEKIMAGLIQPTWHSFKESEIYAMMWGRYRGDGRRTDQYTVLEDEVWR